MSPGKRPGIERKGHTLTEETELIYLEVQDLEIGEHFTLGEQCPLTFLVRNKFVGRTGKAQVDTTVLVGLSNGRAYDKTMYRPALEVLLVPESKVGERLSAALDAFHSRARKGRDRVELGPDVWPATVINAETEDEPGDEAETIAWADEKEV